MQFMKDPAPRTSRRVRTIKGALLLAALLALLTLIAPARSEAGTLTLFVGGYTQADAQTAAPLPYAGVLRVSRFEVRDGALTAIGVFSGATYSPFSTLPFALPMVLYTNTPVALTVVSLAAGVDQGQPWLNFVFSPMLLGDRGTGLVYAPTTLPTTLTPFVIGIAHLLQTPAGPQAVASQLNRLITQLP